MAPRTGLNTEGDWAQGKLTWPHSQNDSLHVSGTFQKSPADCPPASSLQLPGGQCPALCPTLLRPAPEQPLRLRFHSPAGLPGSFFWSWKVIFLRLSFFSNILVLLALTGCS